MIRTGDVFKCPRCGGSKYFHASAKSGWRRCIEQQGACGFQWMEPDDTLYLSAFVPPLPKPPPPPPQPVTIPNPATVLPTLSQPASERGNLRRNCEKWIAEHPEVFELYEKIALARFAAGKSLSISLLTEEVRHEWTFKYNTEFKISNSHRAYISRALVAKHPQLEEEFTFRETRC